MKTASISVLLIDDNDFDREAVRSALSDDRSQSYRVYEATSLREALELCRSHNFDCILIDYKLGSDDGLDGITAVQRQVGADTVPIIMLTASAGIPIAVEAMKRGASDYLTKGEIETELLSRTIRYARDRISLLRSRIEAKLILEESHERLNMTLLAANLGTWEWDMVKSALRCDIHCERLLGLAAGEFEGSMDALRTIVQSSDRHILDRAVEDALNSDKPFACEVRIVWPNGNVRWMAFRGRVYRDNAGKPERLLGTIQDVTDRQLVAIELKRQAQIIEQVHDSIVVMDLQGRITSWNPGAEFVYGYAPNEVIGRSFDILAEPHLRANFSVRVLQPLVHAGQLELEAQNLTKSGRLIWVRQSFSLLRSETGEPYAAVSYTQDITSRRTAEEQRTQLVQQRSALLDSAGEGIIAIDGQGICSLINRRASHLLSYSPEQVIGQNMHQLIHYRHTDGRPYDEDDCPISKTLRGGSQGISGSRDHFWRSDGTAIPVEYSAQPIQLDGRVQGVVLTFNDITERERTESELLRSNEDLQNFAYTVSHDLQTPLRTVTSMSQLLQRRLAAHMTPETTELVTFITDSTHRMSRMLSDLLKYAQIGMDVQIERVSLESALQAALSNLTAAIQETGAQVTHDAMPEVMAHRSQMEQVIQNLIGNAIKYRRQGVAPRVHISVQREGMWWRLCFQDNGQGFTEEQASRIFRVFHRLHGPEVSGTGVGLAICKRIVERYGGEIWAKGDPGEGAQFCLRLPVPQLTTVPAGAVGA